MIARAVSLVGVAGLFAVTPVLAHAQAPSVLLSEGVAAYNDLEFEAASRLLRRALDAEAERKLSPADRDRALMHLGAADLFRGKRDEAVANFRRLVLANPRYRADELTFPPRVTQVFNEVREATKAVAVDLPRERTLAVGRDNLIIRVYVSSAHRIRVVITDQRGRAVRVLYSGPIDESRRLRWDGLDEAGALPATGRYRLDVASLSSEQAALRTTRIPLRFTARQEQLLSVPPLPDPVYRTGRGSSGLQFLIPGVAIGAAVILPAAFGDTDASGARYVIGGAVTLGGIFGFVSERRSAGTVEDAAASDSLRAEWRRRAALIEQENARRSALGRLVIRAGAPRRIEQKR